MVKVIPLWDKLATDFGDWNNVTLKDIDVATLPGMAVYMGAKALAEKEFWKIADETPSVDFTSSMSSNVGI